MFKAIISAIASAFKSAGAFVGRVALAPFKAIAGWVSGGGGGGDIPRPPELDDIEPSERYDSTAMDEFTAARKKTTEMMLAWVAGSLTDGEYRPMPPAMSRALKDWLPGLRASELDKLACASKDEVYGHLWFGLNIDGVRPVQRLQASGWVNDLPWLRADQGSPSFLSVAHHHAPAGDDIERVQALRLASGFPAAGFRSAA